MRITKVDTFTFWADWCNWLFVRVSTDEGLVGWGEGSLHGAIASVETAIREMSPALVGAPFDGVEVSWQRLYHGWRWRGGAIQNTALSAIDLALWDLEGVPTGPGLGAEVNVEAIAELSFRPQPLSQSRSWWS
ncbi:hypothetical protein [Actinopolymorpha sp. B9G3]|uniref:hypothetical protein n=1 Tax=Actinopolymorpha sp. B9G3 TaxID=3158970 RepID=UPI0032D92277